MLDDDPFISEQHAINAAEQSEAVRRVFGQALRNSRIEAGLSPERIEQLTGIQKAELLDIESGRTDPALATVVALSKALGRDVSSLLSAPAP